MYSILVSIYLEFGVPVALAWYSMNLFDRVSVSVDLVSVCDYAVTGLRLCKQMNHSYGSYTRATERIRKKSQPVPSVCQRQT